MQTARFLARISAAIATFASVAALSASCQPTFSDRPSLVSGPRILAVRAEPAETKPGDAATYDALVVGADGTIAAAPAAWAFCVTPKLVAENDSVSEGCLQDNGVTAIGAAAGAIVTTTPMNTCSLFGPEIPPNSGLRPRDPDPTGGYFQPVRVRTSGLTAFGLFRTTCDLANAPGDVVTDFAARYHANQNPHIASLVRVDGVVETPFTAAAHDEAVSLRVHWPNGDAETYAWFDPASVSVVDRRESMRVSFFTTSGSFDLDTSGRAEDETDSFADDVWHAPSDGSVVHMWIVLRDSRGGIAFTAVDVSVR
jgi:hypothetical protein